MASWLALLLPTRGTGCRPTASPSADGARDGPGWPAGGMVVLLVVLVVRLRKLCRTQVAFTQASTFAGLTPMTPLYIHQWHVRLPKVFSSISLAWDNLKLNTLWLPDWCPGKGCMRLRRSGKASSATKTYGYRPICSAPGSRASGGRPRVPSSSFWLKLEFARTPLSLVLP